MLNDDNDSLGLIYTAFMAAPDHKKYEVAARIKRLVNKKPELKAKRGHPVFIHAIEWHLGNLARERQDLQDLFNKRSDAILDGFDAAPPDSLNGFSWFNLKIGERIQELNDLIAGYEAELAERRAYERV